MKDFSSRISKTLLGMGKADDETARLARRTAEVRALWSQAVKKMWRNSDAADLVLAHTNMVGITVETNHRGETYKKMFVYVDDSIVLTELNALRERIKLLFRTDFQEDIQEFEIKISQGARKKFHPYKEENPVDYIDQTSPIALSDEELAAVEERIKGIEKPALQASLRKAMVADLQWKKGLNDKNGQ